MKNIKKGEYGYIQSYKHKKLLAAGGLLAMILFIIITLIVMFGDTKRVGVVFAILLALPFAKYLIAFIMAAKYHSMDKAVFDKINVACAGENIAYDITLAKYEGMRFYYALCVKNGWVYALVPEKDFKEQKDSYIDWIKNTVNDGKYEYKAAVYNNPDEFIKRIKKVSEPSDRTRIIDKYIKNRLIEMGV